MVGGSGQVRSLGKRLVFLKSHRIIVTDHEMLTLKMIFSYNGSMYEFASVLNDLWAKVPLDAREWITRNYKSGLRIIVVLLAAKLLNRYSGKLVHRLMQHAIRLDMYSNKVDRERRLSTLTGLITAMVHFMVWVLSIIVTIGLIGINTTPIFASAGLIGAGFAFGAQSLIKDFLAGIFIISENQYRVGDFVEIMNVSGTVQTIGLRTTVLRDMNGSVHHIPNGSIVVTTNKTVGYGQINLDITVPADTDIDLLEHTINHAGQRLLHKPELKDQIVQAPYFARISDYSGGGLTVKISGQTIGGQQLEVKGALLAEIKKGFDQHGIKVGVTLTPAAKKKK